MAWEIKETVAVVGWERVLKPKMSGCRGRRYSEVFAFVFLLSFPISLAGLQCYECLSLQCDSNFICESVKETIIRTFVPNSHYIHFNPRLMCPGPAVPTNSTEWDALSFNCTRSDSLCLEAPLEVITVFDGKRNGRRLELRSEMSSRGFLRGCANRRGLKELPARTISVKKTFAEDEGVTTEMQSSDEYEITRIHSHEIFVDHGTENATRCYYDNCNNRKKLRPKSGSEGAPRSAQLLLLFPLSIIVALHVKR